MEEGEQKLCLVEPTLELLAETPLQVQVQLMEEMEDMEALGAEEEEEAAEEAETFLLLIIQGQMEVSVELVVMEAVAEQEAGEGQLVLREQEMQEVLVVLEEEAELVEMLGVLEMVEIMVVMAQQEVMAEEAEQEGLLVMWAEVLVAAALVALD